jgi:hypothetical protein
LETGQNNAAGDSPPALLWAERPVLDSPVIVLLRAGEFKKKMRQVFGFLLDTGPRRD